MGKVTVVRAQNQYDFSVDKIKMLCWCYDVFDVKEILNYKCVLWFNFSAWQLHQYQSCQVVTRNMREIIGGSKLSFQTWHQVTAFVVIKISTGDSTLHTGEYSYIDKYFIMYTVAVFFLIRSEMFQ